MSINDMVLDLNSHQGNKIFNNGKVSYNIHSSYKPNHTIPNIVRI